MIEITSTYSFLWLFPIVFISFGLTLLLYFKNKRESFSKVTIWVLALLRFFSFMILGVLLLSPVVKSWKTNIEKPTIIIAADNSKSMVYFGDSIETREKNIKRQEEIYASLSDIYNVDYYSFGDKVEKTDVIDFSKVKTDISSVFTLVDQKYKYSNIGALVIISDGIYNVGNNPIYESKKLKIPIYCIGVGDSTIHRDYSIKRVKFNKNVFINNEFPIEVSVRAKRMANTSSKLFLYNNGKLIVSKDIDFKSENELQKHLFIITAKEAGLQSYKVVINSFDGEHNLINNSKSINIEVLGSKKKVLLLYSTPHPDVSAIKQIFQNTDEYELVLKQFDNSSFNLKDYNLVIFNQLPNNTGRSISVLKEAKTIGIPFIIVLGNNTNVSLFNKLKFGVKINSKRSSLIEMHAIPNDDFKEFIIYDKLTNIIGQFPPLIGPYGQIKSSSLFTPVFKQKIGAVKTEYPLIALSNISGKRDAFIFGEGLWRWRMYDYMENHNHNMIDNFFLKLVRYTSLSGNRSRLNVQFENSYNEQDEVEFSAQFYNNSYESISDADINIEIMNKDKESYYYSFGRKNLAYYLSAGRLQAGVYSFKASVNYGGKTFTKQGKFSVDKVDVEAMSLEADFNLLRKISINSGAKFYFKDDWKKIITDLAKREDIVNIESQQLEYKDVIKFPIILVVLFLFLSLEWFIRKQMGSY
jgi:hypothetical protein